MSSYLFRCNRCLKPFTRQLSLQELKDVRIACPFCRSADVKQQQSSLYPVTAEKVA